MKSFLFAVSVRDMKKACMGVYQGSVHAVEYRSGLFSEKKIICVRHDNATFTICTTTLGWGFTKIFDTRCSLCWRPVLEAANHEYRGAALSRATPTPSVLLLSTLGRDQERCWPWWGILSLFPNTFPLLQQDSGSSQNVDPWSSTVI